MKSLKFLFGLILLVITASCSNVNKNLEKMIPSDASAVYCIKLPDVLEKANIKKDGEIIIPQQLKDVIEKNEGSVFGEFFRNLGQSGLDVDHNMYFFFTKNTFRYVALIGLDDEDAVKKILEHRTGVKFKETQGVNFLRYQSHSFVIDNDVLFMGRENRPAEDELLASSAKSMLNNNLKSIRDVDEIAQCIDSENDINAYFDVKGFNTVLKSISGFNDIIEKYPLLSIFTDSDIKAFTFHINFEKEGANLQAQFQADENSDFVTLLNTSLSTPSNEFLKAMPNSMKYIFSISVKGDKISELDQIRKSLNLLNNFPSLDALNIKSIVQTIDGPLAIGVSPSYMDGDNASSLTDDWNIAIVAKSKNPEYVVNTIKHFAAEMGQPDYVKDGHHVYNYEGKPVYVGNIGDVVYAIRLDHELTEGSYYDYPDLRDRFSKSRFGFYAQADAGATQGFFNFGFTSYKEGKGLFYTANETDNPALTFIGILCTIAPKQAHDEADYMENYDL